MPKQLPVVLLISLIAFTSSGQDIKPDFKSAILEHLSSEQYDQLMSLELHDFDQSSEGFRQYANNYDLIQVLIPEYIQVNELPPEYARNLRFHLGQIHGFTGNYEAAIKEFKQAYAGGSVTWECYVTGTIAFIEKDMEKLKDALNRLQQQDNQMNIQFLEKFIMHFDKPYIEAYNMW